MLNYINIDPPNRTIFFLSISCSLIIPLLVTGPFLPDLLLSLLSLYFLYFSFKYKILNIYKNFYLKVFFCFWIICLISSILSENILYSLKSSFFYIRIGIFSLLIFYLVQKNEKIFDYFYYSFLITFLSLIIDGIYQYFNDYNLLGFEMVGNKDRVSSFFGDQLILGSYLVRLLPLCIALFFIRKKKHKWEFYFFPIFLIFVSILIFLSGERAALFYLLLISFFLILFIKKYIFIRLGILIISILVLSLLLFNNPKLQERYITNPINNMGLNSSESYIFSPSHDSLIKTAWNMFLDKPFFGQGPKLFREKCTEKKYAIGIFPCATHPHNFYIQLLAETGIMGFSFLASFFIYFCYLISKFFTSYLRHKNRILSDYQICLLAGVLITIWPLTPNGNFFNNYLMIIYGLQMGFFKKKV